MALLPFPRTSSLCPRKPLPLARPHQNFSKLSPLDYVPLTNDTHAVTDCGPEDAALLRNLTSTREFFRVSVGDALIANNASNLRAKGYQPTTLNLGPLTRLGGRVTQANIAFDDHPTAKRFSNRIETVTVDSVFDWMQRAQLAQSAVVTLR